MKQRPDRATLQGIVDRLVDPVDALVRDDSLFKKLGLDRETLRDNPEAVIDLLVARPALLQRPIVVTDAKAIIGRPKERVRALLGG